MMNEEIVRLKNAWVRFGDTPILEDINLSIKQNDFIAIICPNGGGKTTLMKVILGLVELNSGEVKVFGKCPDTEKELIGYLPQHTFFDSNFPINVFDVVLMGRYHGVFKRYSKEDEKCAASALETVGMLKFKDRQIGKLSGGQLQRVFVARAIVRQPKLLLLDEPMASVDPGMQKSFYDLLSELRKKMTIVLVTHDIGVVSTHVDEIACLNRRLVYHGKMEGGLKKLEETYNCPIELIAHGVPHRVLRRHGKK